MTPHLDRAARLAMDTIADAPIGAVCRMLRHMDPDGEWPSDPVDLRHYAQDVAHEGIRGDGPEACAVLATVLIEAAPRDRAHAVADESPGVPGASDTETAIDWITSGLETGALTPAQAAGYVRGT
jgi:hypothetical protein